VAKPLSMPAGSPIDSTTLFAFPPVWLRAHPLPKTENVAAHKEDDQQQHQEPYDAAEGIDRAAVASITETAQKQDDKDDDEEEDHGNVLSLANEQR